MYRDDGNNIHAKIRNIGDIIFTFLANPSVIKSDRHIMYKKARNNIHDKIRNKGHIIIFFNEFDYIKLYKVIGYGTNFKLSLTIRTILGYIHLLQCDILTFTRQSVFQDRGIKSQRP